MSDIHQFQNENNISFGSSEETNGPLDQPNMAAAMKLLELQLQVMVIPIMKRIIGPMMETMVRKVVQAELERAEQRFFTKERWKSQDETFTSKLRVLELQFLDKVSLPVYTGKEIKAEGGHFIRLALVDPDTGNFVNSGPEASGKVEIVVQSKVADHGESGESNQTCDEPDNIIAEKEGTRPLLSRNYLNLREGVAVLDNIKFKNKSKWTKNCEVSLEARLVENFKGIMVKDANTETFFVRDCRSTLYKKQYPPSLSDDVCQLEMISRGSPLHKSLRKAKISKVKDFLRLLHMDPQSLQEMLKFSAEKFKVIVAHAQSCVIGENLFLYQSTSCENKVGVVFDIVGRLQGLLRAHQYVPVDKLTEDEMGTARKAVVSAFEHWEDAQPFNESSIANLIPQLSEGISTSRIPGTESPYNGNIGICMAIDGNDHALPSTSSRHMSRLYSFGHTTGFDGFSFPFDSLEFLSQGINYPVNSRTACEDFGDEQLQLFINFDRDDNLQSENPRIETHDHQRTPATGSRVASIKARLRWRMAVVSLSKRTLALGDTRAQKKPRHC